MEKDKSRGIKHLKDKKKYKDNTTKDPKHVPPKTKPSFGSNWDRYEESEETGHELSSSTDFALLANAPISTGTRFRFKIDQLLDEDDFVLPDDALFQLNFRLLDKCVLTLPLYERCGVDKEYFTEQEVNEMDNTAERNSEMYETLLEELGLGKSANKESPTDLVEEVIEQCSIDDGKNINAQICEDKGDENLEQWLDDILDD